MDITIGVDFAASPRNTAACAVHWGEREAMVEHLDPAVDDAMFLALLAHLPPAGRLGIDCPLGWPVAYTASLQAHAERRPWPARATSGDRGDLLWRATDRWVRKHSGRWPLSVSTDRIGVTALRAAYLLDAWEASGGALDRSGVTGPVSEVYPAAARRAWELGAMRSVAELETRMSISFTATARHACETSEHAFDALVAALVARAVAVGRTGGPPAELAPLAAVEGWIHLPTCGLETLTDL